MNEIFFAITIFLIPLAGLQLSNIGVDRGLPFPVVRKIGHICGGISYFLSPFLFSSPFWPIIVSALFTVMLGAGHFFRKEVFRGVGGISRPKSMAEVTYPFGGTVCLLVGWLWLGNPWLGVIPILMMSWGDGFSGLTRYLFLKDVPYVKRAFKPICGSLTFLIVSLLIILLFKPYWVGLAGVIVATVAEGLFGEKALIEFDDNLPIQFSALLVMSTPYFLRIL